MYAIIQTGGKQYKVEKDTVLKVESLKEEVGKKVKLDVVMLNKDGKVLVGDSLKDAYAEAEVTYTSPSVVNYSRALEVFEAGLQE